MRVMQKRNVASVLRALLDQHGISPTELHRRTGVPQSTLSRILSGKIVDPSDKHISKIAEYFAVSTDQLRGRADVAPGDIFLLRGGPHGWHHTGIVTSVGDVLGTTEGNTSPDGSPEGTAVLARERPWRGLDFIRLGP